MTNFFHVKRLSVSSRDTEAKKHGAPKVIQNSSAAFSRHALLFRYVVAALINQHLLDFLEGKKLSKLTSKSIYAHKE